MYSVQLDEVASNLENLGKPKLASQLDIVANTIDKFAGVEREAEIRIPLEEVPVVVLKEGKVELIEQAFIAQADGTDVRIRKTSVQDEKGEQKDSYTMTAKHRPLDQEAETDITEEIFSGLMPIAEKLMSKTRYKWNGWDVDNIQAGNLAGTIVAEYEYGEDEKTVAVPVDWKIKA